MAVLKGGLNFISSVASGGVAHIITTDTNFTSGKLLSIRNNDVEKGYIDYAGNYSGTWVGATVDEAYGGTGQSTYAAGDILYASATNTLSKLAKGTDDQVLTLAAGVPSWADAPSAGTSTLEALTDVTISSVANGEVLVYNSSQWINRTLAEAGVAAASHIHSTSQITNLASWAGSTSITTVGTVSAGTWHGNTLDEAYGGTGLSSYTTGDLVYASSTNNLAKLAVGTNGQILKVTAGLPSWEDEGGGVAHTLGSATHTDVVITSVGDNEVLAYDNSSGYWINQTAAEAGLATASHSHTFASLSSKPTTISGYGITDAVSTTWTGSTTLVTLGTVATGTWNATTLEEEYGGTGIVTYTAGDILYASASNTLAKLGIGDNGDVLKINAGVPSWEAEGGGTAHALGSATHTDVVITTPADNEVLAYDSGGNWINQTAAEAGLAEATHTHALSDVTDAVGTTRTLTINGTTDRVSVTGGTQSLAANRTWTVNVSSNYVGQTSITTLGTVSAGTWQGTPINSSYIGSHVHSTSDVTSGVFAVARGGTGLSSFTAGDIIYASGTNTLAKLGIGSTGQVLTIAAGGVLEWGVGGNGATELPDLTDVTVTSVADLELLQYDSGSGDWINQTIAEIGLVETSRTLNIQGTTNEVSVTGGSQSLASNRTWTIGLPSSVTVTTLNATTGNIGIVNATGLFSTAATGPDTTFGSNITGDSGYRVKAIGSGTFLWGAGDDTYDLNLYRAASGTLKTDYSLYITQNLDVAGDLDVTGNIDNATWHGDTVGTTYGGTGLTSYTTGDILYASASNTLSKLAAGTNGYVLTLAGGVPTWAVAASSGVPTTRTLTISGTSGEIEVSGGTQDLSTNRTWTVALPAGTLYPNDDVNLVAGAALYWGTGADTYISEESTNQLSIVAGSAEVFQGSATDTYIKGGTNIYLQVPGGTTGIQITSSAITANDVINATGGVTVSGGSFTAGGVYTTSANGLVLGSAAGSVNDFTVYDSTGTSVLMSFPTGSSDLNVAGGLVSASGVVTLAETTTPSAVSGYGKIYTKSDNLLYFQDGAGSEHAVDVDGTGGASTLSALSDVVLNSPADDEVLAYDNGTSKWINQTASEAGLSPAAGSSSIVTVGTIGTGTWQGTAVGATYGGTGQTTYAAGDILYASATNTLAKLAKGTNGQVLELSSGLPSWQDKSAAGALGGLTDVVITTPADNELLAYDSGGNWINQTAVEAGVSPAAGSTSIVTVGTITTGTWNATAISTAKGGTGQTSVSIGGILYGQDASTINWLAKGTEYQILTMNTGGNFPEWATPDFGTVTEVTVGTGLDVATGTTTPSITLDLSELSLHSAAAATDSLIIYEDTVGNRRITFAEVDISWFTCVGTGVISNLNADQVDGKDAADFLASGATDAYTSGTLTFNSGTTLTAASGATVNFNNATGTAPFTVASATVVTNLNADRLDGAHASSFLRAATSDNFTSGTLTFNSGTTLTAADGSTVNFDNATGTAPFTVASTTKVTNLNADSVDGLSAASFLRSNANDNYTDGSLTFDSGTILDLASGATLSATAGASVGFNNTTGTAPFTVASTTVVANLNADLLDGNEASAFITDSGDITSVGTLTSGTWHATAIAETYGGTGNTSYATGDILYADATNSLTTLAAGTNGKFLQMVSGIPSWQTVSAVTSVTGGTGIDSTGGTTPSISLDLNELTTSATATGSDYFAIIQAGNSKKMLGSNIALGNMWNSEGWTASSGTVTSVAAGNGMNFTSITGSGSVTMGTPSSLSASSSNSLTSSSHTHAITTTTTGSGSTIVSTTSGGDIYAGGDLVAYYSSDSRLKENIEVVPNALEKINTLRGVTFEWNEKAGEEKQNREFHHKREAGLIAQEVMKVLPEAVNTKRSGYYGIKYEQVLSLVVEAIKELSEKVDRLEA